MSLSTEEKLTRVLYYIAYPQRMAGANRSLFELVRNLPATIKPFVVLATEGEAAEAYRAEGIETLVISPSSSLNRYGYRGATLGLSRIQQGKVAIQEYLPYIFRLRKIIHQLGVNIVHTNDVRGTLLAGVAARTAGCPVVAHIRGEKNPFSRHIWSVYERIPTCFITVASGLNSSLNPNARAKSVTVYNGIQDVSQRGGEIPPWLSKSQAQGKVIVCCLASVVPFKGHHRLLEAVAMLNQRGWHHKTTFVCIGDFPAGYQKYQDWLKRRQQELQIDNLFFTGWQPDPFAFYRAADITVLPSVSREQLHFDGQILEVCGGEGFPRTHLEAMCFSLPIVGTDIAGVQEQIEDGVNGYVVPPANSKALADALEKLIADPTLRAEMGSAGRKRVQQLFSTKSYVHGVLKVYASLVPRIPPMALINTI